MRWSTARWRAQARCRPWPARSSTAGRTRPMKRWLITGCTSGLGRALAQAALARGDAVAATSRRPGLDLSGAIPLQLDVTDPVAVRRRVDEAAAALGGLDVVVNNAGYAL